MKANIQRLFPAEAVQELQDRFIRYVKVWTTSDSQKADEGIVPSTERQLDLAHILKGELADMGIKDARVTEQGYVCARIPAAKGYEHVPSIGFSAHMDTVEEVSGKNVRPQIIREYDGSAVFLPDGVVLDPVFDKELEEARGHTIITTDGTTLLGADDKAGVAEIMEAVRILLRGGSVPHGQIEILFSPDEETGHGMDNVPLDWIQSKQFYTLDGGNPPEIEIECFNACRCDVSFTGKSKHTGTARPDMVNAVSMAADFLALLPRHEAPETTDGYQGFYAPMEVRGQIENASVTLFLRDFDQSGMEKRIETIKLLAKATGAKYTGGSVSVTVTQQYRNMKAKIDERPKITGLLVEAVRRAGAEPVFKPIRGGTDGSRLTELGIPCPNIFTGGHNFHSRAEWASLDQMTLAAETILQLIVLWADQQADG